MTPPVLYFDNPSLHNAWCKTMDFDTTLAAARDQKKVAVAVTQATFTRLDRLIAFASSLTFRPAPAILKFDPRRAGRLQDDFLKYLAELRQLLSSTPVALADPDPDLMTILEDFDSRANDATRPNLLRLLGVLSDDVFIGPHTFHLDISNRCNTNCIFCGLHSPLLIEPKGPIRGRRFTEGWKGRMVDEELFTRLVDDLAEIGSREDILFSGEGEPLTHPGAERMIRYVKAKNLALTLFTNGLAVTENLADMLVETNLDILYWSLSAATPKTFTALQPSRKASDFSRMVEQMKRLAAAKRKGQNKPYIILAHVINNKNFDECERAMDLAVETGVDSVRYQIMHSCSSTESLLIRRDQLEIAEKQIDRARIKAGRANIAIVANIDFQLASAARTYELPETVLPCHWSHDLYHKTGCLAGWFFSRSFTDGRISFCCHDKIVGNLYRARFRDIWFSDRYEQIRRRAKAFRIDRNLDLTDECCGGMLLDQDCDYCGNYEFINQALLDLADLRWDRFLRRDV